MASITAFQSITTAFVLCVSLFRGHNFREDYRKLGTLSSVFPTVKIVAMTATATKEYQTSIMKSLNMKDPKLVAGLPRARSARGTEPHTHGIWSTMDNRKTG